MQPCICDFPAGYVKTRLFSSHSGTALMHHLCHRRLLPCYTSQLGQDMCSSTMVTQPAGPLSPTSSCRAMPPRLKWPLLRAQLSPVRCSTHDPGAGSTSRSRRQSARPTPQPAALSGSKMLYLDTSTAWLASWQTSGCGLWGSAARCAPQRGTTDAGFCGPHSSHCVAT